MSAELCTTCEGGGSVIRQEPTCCGNILHGECRAYCAVPMDVQEPCPSCGGYGSLDADAECTRCGCTDKPLHEGYCPECCR